jgi:hypothetical protein
MRGCTCEPGKCNCKPKPGYPKKVDEAANPAQQAAIAIAKKKKQGMEEDLTEFAPNKPPTGGGGRPKDYGQPTSSRYIGGNKFVVGTTNNYVLTATIDKWGLEWDEDDEIWYLDSPGAAHIADASEGEIELPPPMEQRYQIHDLVTDYLNERNSPDLQKVAKYYGHSDDGEMATESIEEADEWEEQGDKWKRFQKWAIDQMMRSTDKVETGNHVSKLENQYFGHPINVGPSNVLQQPFGTVTTNIGANKKWTEFVQSIIDNYQDYEAQWKADSAAELIDNPEYKKFLDRAYSDFMSMEENTIEQREQHAVALSGYQVKHFGGKLFGSLFGNIKGARASMTPEIYGILEKAEYALGQKKISDWDDKRREEQLKFWQMLPYPIKLMVAAAMGKTPGQVEAILSNIGKSDNELMGAYFNASEPEKPAKPEMQKEGISPMQQGNLMAVSRQYWQKAVLARYPNARFFQQKMINGATIARDETGQVGIYDPKTGYAKVGPESLKTEDVTEGETWAKHNNPRAGGMSKKSVASYRRSHPGSKIQTAVTTKPSKLKKGSKSAKRRASFCARMRGMKKHRTSAKTARDPNSNINKSLRRWHCESIEQMQELVMLAEQKIRKLRK